MEMEDGSVQLREERRKKILCFGGIALLTVTIILAIILATALRSHRDYFEGSMVLDEVPLIDGHNDLPFNIYLKENNILRDFKFDSDLRLNAKWNYSSQPYPSSHTDLLRLRKGKVGAQFWVAYTDCNSTYKDAVERTLEQIDVIKRLVNKYEKHMMFATSTDGIQEAFHEFKIASLIGVEGGHAIDSRLAILRMYYDLGVRCMTLTHNCNTPWADSHVPNAPNKVNGITNFGKAVILEMNRLGMIVDISHASKDVMLAALDISLSPVIFSHSSVRAILDVTRNVDDDIILKLKEKKGILMINFGAQFLATSNASIDDVITHLNYVRNITGSTSYVGIGSDFDGVRNVPIGLEDVSKYPVLFDKLATQTENNTAWTRQELRNLAGLNFLRVMHEVERVRDQLHHEKVQPHEDIIPPTDLIRVKADLTCRTNSFFANESVSSTTTLMQLTTTQPLG